MLTRYDITTDHSYDYEGNVVATHIDTYEDMYGEWVRADEALAALEQLQQKIDSLEREAEQLRKEVLNYMWVGTK